MTDENYDLISPKKGGGLYGQAEVLAHVVRQNRRSKLFRRSKIIQDIKVQSAASEKAEEQFSVKIAESNRNNDNQNSTSNNEENLKLLETITKFAPYEIQQNVNPPVHENNNIRCAP